MSILSPLMSKGVQFKDDPDGTYRFLPVVSAVNHYNAIAVDGIELEIAGKTWGHFINMFKSSGHIVPQLYIKDFPFGPANYWGAPLLFKSTTSDGNNRAIGIDITDTSAAGTIAVTGIEIQIDSPAARTGSCESSAIYLKQSGGGNCISAYKTEDAGYVVELASLGAGTPLYTKAVTGKCALHEMAGATGNGVYVFPTADENLTRRALKVANATGSAEKFYVRLDGLVYTGDKIGIAFAPTNPLGVNRQGDDGTVIDIAQGGTIEGTIAVSGTTVAYNTFMGAHFTQLKEDQKTPPVGAIVIATGEIVPCEVDSEEGAKTKGRKTLAIKKKDVSGITKKEYFSYVDLASERADSRVYGVYHAKMCDDAKGHSFGEDSKAIHQIAALGLYKARVSDTNGNINGGDYIQSSNRAGEGEKQDDDILHNYTVGKSIIDVDWDNVMVDSELGYKWQLIPITLHCG